MVGIRLKAWKVLRMFEKNRQLEKAINNLYTEIKDKEYNDKLSWEELKKLCNVPGMVVSKQQLYYVVNKVCVLLMTHDRKFLVGVMGFGKRIINPDEHSVVAKKVVKKSVKIYRKAGTILASTNMDELNDKQKQEVIESANKYSTLELFASEVIRKKEIGKSSKGDVKTASLFLDAIKLFADKK